MFYNITTITYPSIKTIIRSNVENSHLDGLNIADPVYDQYGVVGFNEPFLICSWLRYIMFTDSNSHRLWVCKRKSIPFE